MRLPLAVGPRPLRQRIKLAIVPSYQMFLCAGMCCHWLSSTMACITTRHGHIGDTAWPSVVTVLHISATKGEGLQNLAQFHIRPKGGSGKPLKRVASQAGMEALWTLPVRTRVKAA